MDIHVNDVGTIFRLRLLEAPETILNVSTGTVSFVFLNPRKRRFVVDAVFTTDGIDGRVQYLSREGDLDIAGRWQYQAKVVFPDGHWSSNKVTFTVKPNL